MPTDRQLEELIARVEADPSRHDEHYFYTPFNTLRRSLEEQAEAPGAELIAEEDVVKD